MEVLVYFCSFFSTFHKHVLDDKLNAFLKMLLHSGFWLRLLQTRPMERHTKLDAIDDVVDNQISFLPSPIKFCTQMHVISIDKKFERRLVNLVIAMSTHFLRKNLNVLFISTISFNSAFSLY